jgi:hypothetical protein
MGEALAKLLSEQEVAEISVMYGAGDCNVALHDAVAVRFEELGGSVLYRAQLREGAPSHASEVSLALAEHRRGCPRRCSARAHRAAPLQ